MILFREIEQTVQEEELGFTLKINFNGKEGAILKTTQMNVYG